jgi:tRNA pseudouridine55 synthase
LVGIVLLLVQLALCMDTIIADRIISKAVLPDTVDFSDGSVILIDKPEEWTSFDVVNKLRFKLSYLLRVKKIKVGHAGTLDPLATGLLVVCTGKMTRQTDVIQSYEKVYTGTIKLGATTPTYDREAAPDQEFPWQHITLSDIEQAAESFLGEILQVPPAYSAVKIKGKAAYELARRGKDVVLEPRKITIKEFRVFNLQGPEFSFEVRCSKGTYIRSLAHDLGKRLNSGAFLSSLRRDAIGQLHVNQAYTIQEFIEWVDREGKELKTF